MDFDRERVDDAREEWKSGWGGLDTAESPEDGLFGRADERNDLDFDGPRMTTPVPLPTNERRPNQAASPEAGGYAPAAAANVWPNNVVVGGYGSYSYGDGAAGGLRGNLGVAGALQGVPTDTVMPALPWNGYIPTAAGAVIPSPTNTAANAAAHVQKVRIAVANDLDRAVASAAAKAHDRDQAPVLGYETERLLKNLGVGDRDQYPRTSVPVGPDDAKPPTNRGRKRAMDANGQPKRSHHKKLEVVITEKDDDKDQVIIAQLHAEVKRLKEENGVLKDENGVLRAGMARISETFTWTRNTLDRVAQPRGGEGGAAS
jgi:hypothetical protein